MKVIALENVRFEGQTYLANNVFEMGNPDEAIKLNIVKLYEEAEGTGDAELEKRGAGTKKGSKAKDVDNA